MGCTEVVSVWQNSGMKSVNINQA